jgi:hypothetical protein
MISRCFKRWTFDIDDKEVEFVERIKSNKKLIKELIKEGFIDNKDELYFKNFQLVVIV